MASVVGRAPRTISAAAAAAVRSWLITGPWSTTSAHTEWGVPGGGLIVRPPATARWLRPHPPVWRQPVQGAVLRRRSAVLRRHRPGAPRPAGHRPAGHR